MNRLKRMEYEYLAVQVFDDLKKYQDLYCLQYMFKPVRLRIIRKMSKPNWEKSVKKYLTDWHRHQQKKGR